GPAVVVRVARLGRLEHRLVERQPGLVAGLGEADRKYGLVAAVAFRVLPGPGAGDALGWSDLAIDAAQTAIGAFGRAHPHEEAAAGAEIDLALRQREAARAPPAGEMLGLAPDLERERARRIEHAGDREGAVGALSADWGVTACGCHASFPWPGA